MDGKIIYEVDSKEDLIIDFNSDLLNPSYEEIDTLNNYNEEEKIFRVALINKADK